MDGCGYNVKAGKSPYHKGGNVSFTTMAAADMSHIAFAAPTPKYSHSGHNPNLQLTICKYFHGLINTNESHTCIYCA